MTDENLRDMRDDLHTVRDLLFMVLLAPFVIVALLIKLDIVERWASIDATRGRHVFRELVERLRNEAEIPQEFRQ